MVICYNSRDMAAFAQSILDDIKTGKKTKGPDGNYVITHPDFCNWKDAQISEKYLPTG